MYTWEQRKLSDISTKVTTKNVDVHYTETLTNSAEQGIISQVDFFDKEISNKDNINGYYIVENNDFIYNPRISTLAPVGPINRNKLNRTGIMSPLYTVFRSSNIDLDFLEWYFQSSHWHRYMKLNGDSGARADRIAIKDSTFFDMPIKTPVNIKEQVLIGETLEKFNQYITLHQRKLEHLNLKKKALLQKLFPKNGERYPELRFPGFTDAWEQRKFGEIMTFLNGRAYKQDELLGDGKYKVLRVGNFYTNDSWYYSNLELDDKFYATNGDLLYTWSATFGPHIWKGEKVIYHYHIWKLVLQDKIDKLFALQLLEVDKANIMSDKNGSTMVHITKQGMENKQTILPISLNEQKQIAKFLSSMDKLITLHQRKLEHLQLQKKALLQQMFV